MNGWVVATTEAREAMEERMSTRKPHKERQASRYSGFVLPKWEIYREVFHVDADKDIFGVSPLVQCCGDDIVWRHVPSLLPMW